ncbi:tetratricopeptide repeat protein [Ammoniphilus sp. CFH 90114]|uniref:tetratricopeptide repeat protein n=1 Tax=Ammoniphilus sp. CFH 90114 TaxID=2493665 RepID=UPI00100F58C7|nr:tetratricopeptide repeat protein [Ammoniphilus sp. CFH 90114]RXT14672.1 tetratricopeptide repeat protein [Ammoniphilus sp. CFH 90114]
MVNKKQGNVVLFPQLLERHLEIAMEAREQGNFQLARTHLEQAHELEPDDTSVLFGLMVTYFELGMYREAERIAEQILDSNKGEFSEVMHLYVLALVQQEKYDQVCDVLEPLLDHPLVPDYLQKEFTEILQTCQLLRGTIQEEETGSLLRKSIEEKLRSDPDYLNLLINDLLGGEVEKQLQAIEQLKFSGHPEAIRAILQLLTQDEADPVLKTLSLYALKELGWAETVSLNKFGQWFSVDLAQLPEKNRFGNQEQRVMEIVAEIVADKDPSLLSFALQLWVEYMYACYPKPPLTGKVEGWAGALHFVTTVLLGQVVSKQELASLYSVSVSTLTKNYKVISEFLKFGTQDRKAIHKLPLDGV